MAGSKETTQKHRFEEAARELGVDLDEDKLKDALRRMRDLTSPKPPKETKDQSNDEH